MLKHLEIISINEDWETPSNVFDNGVLFAGFSPALDVCATIENTKCDKFYTKELDALDNDNPWNEDFFMNPPYGRQIGKWLKKAYEEHKKHNVSGLCLVFAKTDTRWWHKYIEGKARVFFIKGRIRFLVNGKLPLWCKFCQKHFFEVRICPECNNLLRPKDAPYPSCFVVYDKK